MGPFLKISQMCVIWRRTAHFFFGYTKHRAPMAQKGLKRARRVLGSHTERVLLEVYL